jgi:hypothetical protein
VTDDEEPDLQHELPDAAHDELRRALRWAIRHIRNLEHGNAPGAGSTDQTGDTIDVIPITATAAGAAKGLGIKLDTGWTWRRITPNGTEISRGQTYADQWDAWRGAHRANPGLPWLTTHTPTKTTDP